MKILRSMQALGALVGDIVFDIDMATDYQLKDLFIYFFPPETPINLVKAIISMYMPL